MAEVPETIPTTMIFFLIVACRWINFHEPTIPET